MSLMIRNSSDIINQMLGSPINSKKGKQMLKSAGIDTNSKQYKAAMNMMTSSMKGGAVGYTNPQAIKNLMSSFDKDGNLLNAYGVAGMDATGIPESERHQIIDVSKSARQKMFDETKRHFMQENGVANGDTTRRSEVFRDYQLSVPIGDRLKGTWTLGQYERQYRQALYDACKETDPSWKIGKKLPAGALNNVTRESVDSTLVKSGDKLVKKNLDVKG